MEPVMDITRIKINGIMQMISGQLFLMTDYTRKVLE